ncbi:hypothetical protein DRJ19_02825 [Candidatus Woesearchaeota archaeon]|nr:MAG: hypothetical protein DRJ19_02825 [Candidatus Woesearchaeota archaeon]
MRKSSVDTVRRILTAKVAELWPAVERVRNRAYNAQERWFGEVVYYWAYSDLARIAGISPARLSDKELVAERIDKEIRKVKQKADARLKCISEMSKDKAIDLLLVIERILAIGRGENPWEAEERLEAELMEKGLF